MPEATVPKVGQGHKMGRIENILRLCFCGFPIYFLSCFIARTPKANGMGRGSIGLLQARFYSHVNGRIGIVQNSEYEIRRDLGCTTLETSRKVVLDNPSVRVCVCLSLSV